MKFKFKILMILISKWSFTIEADDILILKTNKIISGMISRKERMKK